MLIARKDKGKGTAARGAKQCAQRGDAFRGRCDGQSTGKIKQGEGVLTEESFAGHFDFAKRFEPLLLYTHSLSVASYAIFGLRCIHQVSVGRVHVFLLCKEYGNVKTSCFL